MPLLPRWRFMTDEAKALTRRAGVSLVVVIAALLLFRGLLIWALLGVIAWWLWTSLRR